MTLLETQRKMAAAVMTPLTPGGHVARSMRAEAASFLKPNDRLTSLERLEIYSRSYWYRLLDSLRDDFPGLVAVVGSKGFERLSRAYLRECPSQSFTLRDLGSRLESWLAEHPEYAGRNHRLALDMARLEWAHIQAFDGVAREVPGPEDLGALTAAARFGVQPYISLLELQYPVDELRILVNADPEGSTTASNFTLQRSKGKLRQAHRLPAEQVFLAVHRLELSVYYRRLTEEEFRLLGALAAGRTVGRAIRDAFAKSSVDAAEIPGLLQEWFARWAQFGWLCNPRKTAKGRPS